jgi:competence ComEA-like helix-hairpin-helix protein
LELDVPPAQVQKYSAYRPGIGAWFVMLAILMLVQRQNYWSIVGPVETTIAPRFRVDLNRAGLGELANLTEVGAVQASAIIDYRKQVGRFESIDQLRQVRGIGAVTLGRLRPFIYIEEHSSLRLASTPQSVAAP